MPELPTLLPILDDLVALPTVPGEKNREWLDYVSARLVQAGCRVTEVPSPTAECTGLIARIGPDLPGGILLSGHMDVVSTEGQEWTSDPFRLRQSGDRVFGRGVTDMKGFVACAIAIMEEAARHPPSHPIHLALSADEETTCRSAQSLAAYVAEKLPPPRGIIIGEPTLLRPTNRHKGSYTYEVTITGRAAHASRPELGVSATALAARLITWIDGQSAAAYSPDLTTHSVGIVDGGSANNIIAGHCRFEWDIRLAPGDQLDQIERTFQGEAERLLSPVRGKAPEADISLQQTASFPGFYTPPDHPFTLECLNRSGAAEPAEFPAGTEAGIYGALGIPVIVMGPGDIAQAHIADEFLDLSQLERCAAQLRAFL